MKSSFFFLLVLVLISGVGGGWSFFQSEANLRVWAVEDMVKVRPTDSPQSSNTVFDAREGVISLFSGRNETLSFQIVMSGGSQPLTDVRIEPSSLLGQAPPGEKAPRIDPKDVELFKVEYVSVHSFPSWYVLYTPYWQRPGRFPDPLLPLKGRGVRVPAKENTPIWVDLHVPAQLPAGVYRGIWRVKVPWGPTIPLKIELQVFDYVLPETRHCQAVAFWQWKPFAARQWGGDADLRDAVSRLPARLDGSDKASKTVRRLIEETLKLAHRHRIDLMVTDLSPPIHRDLEGNLVAEWDGYSAVLAGAADGSLFADAISPQWWLLPINQLVPPAHYYGGADASGYRRTFIEFARRCLGYVSARGWSARHFFRMDVPGRHPKAASAEVLGTWLKENDPRSGFLKDVLVYGRDIRALPAREVKVGTAREKARPAGEITWLASDRPPFIGSLAVFAPGSHHRVWPWIAFAYGLDTLDLGWVGHCEGYPLIYPGSRFGRPGPVGSIRLKLLRRGLQDYEALRLLKVRERTRLARMLQSCIVSYACGAAAGRLEGTGRGGGWSEDLDVWSRATALLAEEVSLAVKARRLNPDAQFSNRITWKRLLERSRRDWVEPVGLKMTPIEGASSTAPAGWVMEADLDIGSNRVPCGAGRLSFGASLPADWTPLSGTIRLPAAKSGEALRQQVRVSARTDRIKPDENGIIEFPLLYHRGDDRRKLGFRLSWIECPRVAKGPRIDGDLSDWPLRPGNHAGRFVPISGPFPKKVPLPAGKTEVNCCRDNRWLYFGFRCELSPDEPIRVEPSNFVRYDGLLASGEEMVEVILIPPGEAVGAKSLYRVMIKANGSAWVEKGLPPVSSSGEGSASVWPARTQLAVKRVKNGWFAELRIRLDSLGPSADSGLWRVNFARYRAEYGQITSWSGATATPGRPGQLGFMRVAERIEE